MNEQILKFRILARAEVSLVKAEARRRSHQVLLATIAIGCLFMALIFLNVGAFVYLMDIQVNKQAAFIVAVANLLLGFVPWLLMNRKKEASPEENMVREIRDVTAEELTRDINSGALEIGALSDNLKQLRSSLGSGGLSFSSLGTVLPLVIDLLKKRQDNKP